MFIKELFVLMFLFSDMSISILTPSGTEGWKNQEQCFQEGVELYETMPEEIQVEVEEFTCMNKKLLEE